MAKQVNAVDLEIKMQPNSYSKRYYTVNFKYLNMKKKTWNDEQFINAVKTSTSYAEVIRKLGLKVAGSNYDTVKRTIKELNLDISHMKGFAWNKGIHYVSKQSKPLSEILVEHSSFISTYKLKNKLFKEKIKERKCEMCGLKEWEGHDIPLELHHKSGIKDDLRLENLQILCPNCHALTDNYRGKNIGMSA